LTCIWWSSVDPSRVEDYGGLRREVRAVQRVEDYGGVRSEVRAVQRVEDFCG